jgi:hypothetical protein
MKTLKCDLCDATAQGETFEEWMTPVMGKRRWRNGWPTTRTASTPHKTI